MHKIIVYQKEREWLSINLPASVRLAQFLTATPVEGGIFYAALIQDGAEIYRTPNVDKDTISRHIDALIDHLADTSLDEKSNSLSNDTAVTPGTQKTNRWMFWSCLGFLGFSALHILYKTIASFFKTPGISLFLLSINFVLAIFLIWGIIFFVLKKRKQNPS